LAESDRAVDELIHSLAGAVTLESLPQVVDVLREPPPNPPEIIQAQFVGASYVIAYAEAASFVRVADEWSNKHRKRGLASADRVIDFGSGWGRVSRILLTHVAPAKLYALDVNLEMTTFVNSTLPGVNALTVSPFPPTVLRDGVVDAILAFSVFSHLTPESHKAWAEEFGRILGPSGMVFLTLLDRALFDQVRATRDAVEGGSTDAFALSLSQCFPDLDEARTGYDAGEPAYAGMGGGGVLTGDYYGWAAVPPEFMARVWGEAGFDVVEWVPSGTLFPQAMVGLVKRPVGDQSGAKTGRARRFWRSWRSWRRQD
jgi:hypothetical protein